MIGKLDQRVTLQAYSTSPDGAGGATKSWANLASVPTVWARVQNAAGNEHVAAGGVAATAMMVFTIRNRSDLSEADRIIWNGETYNIRLIKREGARKMYLKIEAERGAVT